MKAVRKIIQRWKRKNRRRSSSSSIASMFDEDEELGMFEVFPDEICIEIFSFLPVEDLCQNVALVNKRFGSLYRLGIHTVKIGGALRKLPEDSLIKVIRKFEKLEKLIICNNGSLADYQITNSGLIQLAHKYIYHTADFFGCASNDFQFMLPNFGSYEDMLETFSTTLSDCDQRDYFYIPTKKYDIEETSDINTIQSIISFSSGGSSDRTNSEGGSDIVSEKSGKARRKKKDNLRRRASLRMSVESFGSIVSQHMYRIRKEGDSIEPKKKKVKEIKDDDLKKLMKLREQSQTDELEKKKKKKKKEEEEESSSSSSNEESSSSSEEEGESEESEEEGESSSSEEEEEEEGEEKKEKKVKKVVKKEEEEEEEEEEEQIEILIEDQEKKIIEVKEVEETEGEDDDDDDDDEEEEEEEKEEKGENLVEDRLFLERLNGKKIPQPSLEIRKIEEPNYGLSTLKYLDLTGCHLLTDFGAKYLTYICRDIEHLCLRGCMKLTDKAIEHFNDFGKIQSINLAGLNRLSDRSLEILSTKPLKCVDLTFVRRLTDVGLTALAQCGETLEDLNLQCCSLITSKGLDALLAKCHKIKRLNLTGCHLIELCKLERENLLADRSVPKLKYLNLLGCTKICDDCIRTLYDSMQCYRLSSLSIAYTDFISDAALNSIMSYSRKWMEELIIKKCPKITSTGVNEMTKKLKNLNVLDLSQCSYKSNTFKRLKNMKSLEKLVLVRSPCLNDNTLRVLTRIRSLKVLDLSNNDDVSFEGLCRYCSSHYSPVTHRRSRKKWEEIYRKDNSKLKKVILIRVPLNQTQRKKLVSRYPEIQFVFFREYRNIRIKEQMF